MQCACAMLSSVACPALQIVFTLSHRKHDFRKKSLLNVKCFSIFCTAVSDTLLFLRRNERDMIEMCFGLHVKYRLLLYYFNET